jgi:hypothetical protein
MSDTPQYIKDKQLAIWLNKTPSERLKQTLADNEALFLFWENAKIKKDENKINAK